MSAHHHDGPRVLKHPLISRLFHWGLILGFIPAALSGFVIWLKPGSEDFINFAMKAHIVGAAILTASIVLFTIFGIDRIVGFIRRIFYFDDKDIGWMLVGGGYPQKMFLGKKITIPPMGKMNSGQKIFGICLLLGAAFLVVSGWILYAFIPVAPKAFVWWLDMGHLVLGIFLALFMFVHIFLGIYNWGEFIAMFTDGTVPREEAEEVNPTWVANEIEPVKSPGAEKTVSV
jgi:formate dehydrogenase subunit gamma